MYSDEKAREIPGDLEHLASTSIDEVPHEEHLEKALISDYKYRYTTGPFVIPEVGDSLNTIVLNNDVVVQKVRVIVAFCPIAPKYKMSPRSPTPIEVTLTPGGLEHITHSCRTEMAYEVQIECNSRLIFPYFAVWPAKRNVTIPGTAIYSANFLRMMP